ncbi:MAG: hypothetical protein M1832_001029 [Thelocarpon impressellum]|nr:MAG: hypothetical protein M1832_001029 [Thelocarpon impressellum]
MSSLSRRRSPVAPPAEKTQLVAPCADIPPSTFLVSMLPARIQNRIPRLPSLRRTQSQSKSRAGGVSGGDGATKIPAPAAFVRAATSGTQTPPPAYAAARSSPAGSPPRAAMYDGDDMSVCDLDENQLWREPRPSSAGSVSARQVATRPAGPRPVTEKKTGIAWKFARQGLNLIGLSVEESRGVSDEANDDEAMLGRQLYIHGLTYLLKGLPSDLTPEEQLTVRGALPETVAEPLRLEVRDQQLLIGSTGDGHSDAESAPETPSMLHRALASTIVQLFLLLQLLLPYAKTLLVNAYAYERSHRVSEKMLAGALDAADALGRRGVEVGGAVGKMGDGRVGQMARALAAWWVESVAGGICDGVGEGMVILGAKRAGSPPPAQEPQRGSPRSRGARRAW